MDFVSFIEDKGVVKTSAGHFVKDIQIRENESQYPIGGVIVWDNGFRMPMIWDKEGNPHNLPLNHGLNLIAMVPRIVYDKL